MNCIIVDDEPVARKGMKSLIEQVCLLYTSDADDDQ